jgi:hypothetical protein
VVFNLLIFPYIDLALAFIRYYIPRWIISTSTEVPLLRQCYIIALAMTVTNHALTGALIAMVVTIQWSLYLYHCYRICLDSLPHFGGVAWYEVGKAYDVLGDR